MDGTTFDKLARDASRVMNRRGTLGLVLGGVVAAVTAGTEMASAKGGKKKKKRCRKLTQGCGGKNKCCTGLTCTNGACACPAGTVASGNTCVPQLPGPACTSDAQCGSGQVCQGGACVPKPPQCVNDADCGEAALICENGECVIRIGDCEQDDDCGPNEVCGEGPVGTVCVCLEQENGLCIRRCDKQSDCAGGCSCRNHFPEDSQLIKDGICVKEPFILCDAKTCDADSDCRNNEICVGTECGSNGIVFKCSPICTL